jgi:ComF family protein
MLTRIQERLPFLRGLLDFAYPPLCLGCGEFFEGTAGVCPKCWEAMPWYERPFYLESAGSAGPETDVFPLFAAGNYVDPLKQIVINFKFRGAAGAADSIAQRVAATFGHEIEKLAPGVLVPIPLHASREYYRGYNQAAVFAEALARNMNLPTDNQILLRLRKRRLQAGLRQSQRAINIRGVFAVPESRETQETANIMLVDDVFTSGQTVFEARRVLLEAGYRWVGAISMAHGL